MGEKKQATDDEPKGELNTHGLTNDQIALAQWYAGLNRAAKRKVKAQALKRRRQELRAEKAKASR